MYLTKRSKIMMLAEKATLYRDRPFLIGLDPNLDLVPQELRFRRGYRRSARKVLCDFNQRIVEATHDICAGYKLNLAYYLEHWWSGIQALADTLNTIHSVAPDAFTVLDAKFGDIARTCSHYARFFHESSFDAVTVAPPYFEGVATLETFYESTGSKGIFVVCRTSDPSADNMQTQTVVLTDPEARLLADQCGRKVLDIFEDRGGMASLQLYQWMAAMVMANWTRFGMVGWGLVMAAQHPQAALAVRKIVGDNVPFLVPGIGAQGGDVKTAVQASRNSQGGGFLLSSSSAIIHASSGSDFAELARQKAIKLAAEIEAARKE
jgi:orotidine-5'-phosphate decarboxylase